MALHMVQSRPTGNSTEFQSLIDGGLNWLADHQNADGGWGDTVKSLSNISTTMLAHAVFHATETVERFSTVVAVAQDYLDLAGGVPAVKARYGKDRTFSVPILTHCALAGIVDWEEVAPLPFELACVPPQFYKTIRLPVVSYALPALIAIGQARFHHRPPRFWPLRGLRRLAISRSLKLLERIQPTSGGFLEAAPLTSFVAMSLASCGLESHPVVERAVQFLVDSVQPDGSWPIDTNLATWTTTLSVNALDDEPSEPERAQIRAWLLGQQYREVHPYTNADPGGWAWTDLPGGVPDADDTPGAILALLKLRGDDDEIPAAEAESLNAAIVWLLDLQNRDGGWPTFCRGWGALPFDRSAPDLTAHCIRACRACYERGVPAEPRLLDRTKSAIERGFRYFATTQRENGSWLPLWFGNQFAQDDENPVYGTARVLAAYRDMGMMDTSEAKRGLKWLESVQNRDGGWGGDRGIASSVEETALASEIMLGQPPGSDGGWRGIAWLLDAVERDQFTETTPIGFYFAKLWYFERLYPIIFTVAALGHARELVCGAPGDHGNRAERPVSHSLPD